LAEVGARKVSIPRGWVLEKELPDGGNDERTAPNAVVQCL